MGGYRERCAGFVFGATADIVFALADANGPLEAVKKRKGRLSERSSARKGAEERWWWGGGVAVIAPPTAVATVFSLLAQSRTQHLVKLQVARCMKILTNAKHASVMSSRSSVCGPSPVLTVLKVIMLAMKLEPNLFLRYDCSHLHAHHNTFFFINEFSFRAL